MSSADSGPGRTGGPAVAVLDERAVAPEDPPCVLAGLSPGTRATVVRVAATDSPSIARRLADLGFTPGTAVEVVRRAPLRDPVVYLVKDYEVCLRRAQAACVQVRPEAVAR